MMKNYDESVEINHDSNWPYIPDHPYKILIIGGLGSGKTNVLLHLIKHQRPDNDKIYLYVKDPLESKYQVLINRRRKVGTENLKNPKSFIVYQNLEDYNKTKKRRVLTVFDDMIEDMESNEKLSPVVTELFVRERKLKRSLVFISQYYFKVSKATRVNATKENYHK